jgi:hypothetical protein
MDGTVSNFAFKFNLRRYIKAQFMPGQLKKVSKAGAYTRPLFSST